MKLVRLTALDGVDLWINPETIQRVREPMSGEYGPGASAVLIDYHGPFAVRERVDLVVNLCMVPPGVLP